MPNLVDRLLTAYELVLKEPWSSSLSGKERIWFLVYDPGEQRKIDLRLDDFETVAKKVGKSWVDISFKDCFPSWMANHEYRDEYFNDPKQLVDQLEAEFKRYAIQYCKNELDKISTDDNTLIVLKDVSSLFGFVRLSSVLDGVSNSFKGRILVFFPGEYDKNHYRLLDARDGWSYLARPIIA
ncbi:MAG: DUF1788 domain-containing protein [Ignavibacteriae bacterium]|nr:DUF1788 domain-containing protein [Ignavibacteriota bacterium]